MSKKKKDDTRQQSLPDVLAAFVASAKDGSLPTTPTEADRPLETLFELLRPCLVPDRKWNGQGRQKAVLREPLLMVAWDRRARAWKVTVADKQLNLSWTALAADLAGCLEAFSEGVRLGKVLPVEKEISIDLTEAIG